MSATPGGPYAPPQPPGPVTAMPHAPPLQAPGPTPAGLSPPELRLTNDIAERAQAYAPPPLPAAAPQPVGPSDFTRMLTPVEPPAPAPAPPPLRPAAPAGSTGGARKPSLVPLIIVLNIALVAGAALILYFVLRGK